METKGYITKRLEEIGWHVYVNGDSKGYMDVTLRAVLDEYPNMLVDFLGGNIAMLIGPTRKAHKH